MADAAQIAQEECDKNVERWRLKKMIENLESAKGNGTSVISLYMTPKDQLAKMTTKLTEEHGTASNIKSASNRNAVQTAITACLGRLRMYKTVPTNGLIVYCGTVLTEDNKEKKITFDFEPVKPVSRSMYHCDNKFHTDELRKMLESDEKFGFIVIDGTGTLFATMQGSQRDIIHRLTVDLPKKHGRGGQSKNRFARIREEKRHNYVHKVAELATQFFINVDRPNVAGLVLAGSADFKDVLAGSDLFDPRLKAVVVAIVDIAHPGEVGFNQAIDMSADVLSGVKLVQEKKLLQRFMDEIAQNTDKYCFAIVDTMKALKMGAVHTLIVWEELAINRYTITNPSTGEVKEEIMTAADAGRKELKKDPVTGMLTNEVECCPLVEYLAENYKKFGCVLEFVTNRCQEGAQFVRGFGGIGGLMRYRIDFVQLDELERGDVRGVGGDNYDLEDDFI
jgi:peptide chain release factor subunit 1